MQTQPVAVQAMSGKLELQRLRITRLLLDHGQTP